MVSEKIKKFFFKKIEMIPEGGCWLWMGTQKNTGYGVVSIKNKKIRAHRLSWQIHNGEIPNNLNVLHHCDVPCCVNPYHLFLGTQADNVLDCIKKGRAKFPIGPKITKGRPKISPLQVKEIRESNAPRWFLSKKYGLHISQIGKIIRKEKWKKI